MTAFLLVPLIALAAALVAVTLPVTVELAVLTAAYFLPRRNTRLSSAAANLRLAVIVPAHNEELLVARTIESLRASAAASGTRIILIAHNSSDETAARAAEAGAEVLVYNDPEARGKGFALRHGFDYVFSHDADAALVIDADSTVSPNLIDVVREALAGGADAVQCRYDMNVAGDRTRGRLAALALRGFNLVRPAGRQRLGLSSAILGNGFAVRKSVFRDTPYNALSLVEDLEYHIHLVMAGKRVEFLEQATVSAELPETPAGEATQRSRWEGGRIGAARQWMAPLAKQVLRGRLRLLDPLLDLAGLPIAYDAFLLLVALALPFGWLRVYSATALLVLALHVMTAAWAGDDFLGELRLVCMAPAYIFWKLCMLPRLIRGSAANTQWVRTERAPAARKL
jgi:cellulose synthase/poly-beta-1,6-N-acetylglucosamine synthase-like glycosyltransferase